MTGVLQFALLPDAVMPGFDRWWTIYPHKVAKKDARKAWRQLAPSESLEDKLYAALQEQIRIRHRLLVQRQWVADWPHPATWIRGERWEDELAPVPRMTMASSADLQQLKDEANRRRDARAGQ
jgi:hypothetical protein